VLRSLLWLDPDGNLPRTAVAKPGTQTLNVAGGQRPGAHRSESYGGKRRKYKRWEIERQGTGEEGGQQKGECSPAPELEVWKWRTRLAVGRQEQQRQASMGQIRALDRAKKLGAGEHLPLAIYTAQRLARGVAEHTASENPSERLAGGVRAVERAGRSVDVAEKNVQLPHLLEDMVEVIQVANAP
jgi:hypothetical protein